MVMFSDVKNRCILHGRVFVINSAYVFYFQMLLWKGLLVYSLSCFLAAVYVQAQGKIKEKKR